MARVPRIRKRGERALEDPGDTKLLVTMGALELFLLAGGPIWYFLGWIPPWALVAMLIVGVALLLLTLAMM